MPFQYTFRSDDITTWDVDTRDLLENRDRELELYSTTIDDSFLNLNASNLTSGTVPSARMTGAYTGITGLGTLGSLIVTGDLTVDTNTLRVDSTNNRVGINVTAPTSNLDVVGNQVIRAAATQDGIQLAGRAGGTGSATVKLIPTTLTANRTLTLPDVSGTAITTGNLSDITAVGTLASGSIPATLLTGTIASARISGSYTGITGVGTLAAGSIPATLLTGIVASARLSGGYTGITSLGTLTGATIDGASSASFTLGDWPPNGNYGGVVGNMGYLLVGNNSSDTAMYLRTSTAGAVNIGANGSNTLTVGNGTATFSGTLNVNNGLNMQNTAIDFADSVNPNANNAGFVGFPFGLYKAWAWVAAYNFHTASDVRYKQNIETLPLGINFLRLINPIKFTYLYPQFEQGNDTPISVDAGTRPRAGLSAQNVRQALDTLGAGDYNFWCLTNKDNAESMQILDYTGFVAPIIQAIKELDQRLQQLETV